MDQQRDLRIDFFRGLALWMIFIDHIEWGAGVSTLSEYTLYSLGFCDAADVLVFVSGWMFGLVYDRLFTKRGYWAVQRKSLRRSGQIYLAQTVPLIILLIAVGTVFHSRMLWLGRFSHLYFPDQLPGSALSAMALLHQPYGFAILPLYCVLLIIMPIVLAIYRTSPLLAIAISAQCYLIAQFFPDFNLPRYPEPRHWLFNPWAWQLLFFVGMSLSIERKRGTFRIPRSRWLLFLSLLLALLAFIIRNDLPIPFLSETAFEPLAARTSQLAMHYSSKSNLGPIRILHFLTIAYLATYLLPREPRFWQHPLTWPIIICGQHALPVYSLGLLLSHFGVTAYLACGATPSVLLCVLVDSLAVMVLAAYLLDRRRRDFVEP